MILCVGLTPTVQRTQFFETFAVGAVNRAKETLVTASGKGANVARVITSLGGSARLVHTLGGDTGRFVAARLDAEGVAHHPVWSEDDAPTRTCTTLLVKDGPTTELVEEAQPVAPHDAILLLRACETALLEANALCLSGSLPRGISDDFYATLVERANAYNIPVVVDAQKAPLKRALAQKPFLVKPNREEASATLGFPLTGDADADARTAIRELTAAGAQWALVSMGSAGSLLGDGTSLWRITPPVVEALNPIGSGDSLAAGLTFAHIEQGKSVPEAVAFGTAVAAANCLTPTSGVIRPKDVARLAPQVGLLSLE
jgi:tagatose 6-phosphate kinase